MVQDACGDAVKGAYRSKNTVLCLNERKQHEYKHPINQKNINIPSRPIRSLLAMQRNLLESI